MQTLEHIQEAESHVLRCPSDEGERLIAAAYRALWKGHASPRLSDKAASFMVARIAAGLAIKRAREVSLD